MGQTDEQRYHAHMAQQAEADTLERMGPLQQVKALRSEQLQVCDLKKRRELERLLNEAGLSTSD